MVRLRTSEEGILQLPVSVLKFTNVTKRFYRNPGNILLRNHFARMIKPELGDSFLAISGVSFELKKGESLGVIGANGAGKSTLLSLATGLVPADEGTVELNGRMAALMELGSGFHPDLTGRENVFINAALLGLSRERTKAAFDAIVAFSEIEDFIDEPLRTYSAGMAVRLAFSIAVNVDPDVLIIDEVLAVGDASFHQKCVEHISGLRKAGKSLLFVSHSPSFVQSMCNRVMWLEQGKIRQVGPAADVVPKYIHAMLHEPQHIGAPHVR